MLTQSNESIVYSIAALGAVHCRMHDMKVICVFHSVLLDVGMMVAPENVGLLSESSSDELTDGPWRCNRSGMLAQDESSSSSEELTNRFWQCVLKKEGLFTFEEIYTRVSTPTYSSKVRAVNN